MKFLWLAKKINKEYNKMFYSSFIGSEKNIKEFWGSNFNDKKIINYFIKWASFYKDMILTDEEAASLLPYMFGENNVE